MTATRKQTQPNNPGRRRGGFQTRPYRTFTDPISESASRMLCLLPRVAGEDQGGGLNDWNSFERPSNYDAFFLKLFGDFDRHGENLTAVANGQLPRRLISGAEMLMEPTARRRNNRPFAPFHFYDLIAFAILVGPGAGVPRPNQRITLRL